MDIPSLKIEQIRAKLSESPICENLGYVQQNVVILKQIGNQFYNPQLQQILTCVARSAFKFRSGQEMDVSTDPAVDLAKRLQSFYQGDNDILKYFTIRTASLDDRNKLINEAYAGIVYLNNLRAVTPSFKYMYTILFKDKVPYLVEESLEDATPLADILTTLPADQSGVNIVKSIFLQLFTAVSYASNQRVSRFSLLVRVRQVDIKSTIPIFLNESVMYANTYGYVPVFERYDNVSTPFDGTPKSIYDEQKDLSAELFRSLQRVNPNLAAMMPIQREFNLPYFTPILVANVDPTTLLNCTTGSCFRIDGPTKVPFGYYDTYVKSLITRMDELQAMLENASVDNAFMISAVLVRYAQLLESLYQQLDPTTRDQVFLGQRKVRRVRSQARLEGEVAKSDITFVRESLLAQRTSYRSKDYIKSSIDNAVDKGRSIKATQDKMVGPMMNTKKELNDTLINYRALLANLNYYETLNGMIEAYRKYIEPYPLEFRKSIESARVLKEQYEQTFQINSGVLLRLLTPAGSKAPVIQTNGELILTKLYDIFVEKIPESLETASNDYLSTLNKDQIDNVLNQIYQRRIIASDPIAVLLP